MLGTELALLLLDAVERGFSYVLIAMAAHLLLIAMTPARQSAEPIVVSAVPIIAAFLAISPAALMADGVAHATALLPLFWILAAGLFVATLAVSGLSHHGRLWRAMTADVKALSRIGIAHGRALASACLLAMAMAILAGVVAHGTLPHEPAGWLPFAAILILVVRRRLAVLFWASLGLAVLETMIMGWRGEAPPSAIALIVLIAILWRGRALRQTQAAH